jgi:hypothetical protein
MGKWYESKVGWLAHFKNNYEKIRPLVAFLSGPQAGNFLDKLKDVDESSSDEDLRILYGILKRAWNDALQGSNFGANRNSEEDLSYLTGWIELYNLYSESYILWEERKHVVAI